ncbi:tripartite tricarboxylate transporter substrate-binding protein [Roseomonas sp. GCM10028921]
MRDTELTARRLALSLGEQLNGVVVVENRAGGGGNIGAERVARSAPDALGAGDRGGKCEGGLRRSGWKPARGSPPRRRRPELSRVAEGVGKLVSASPVGESSERVDHPQARWGDE